MFEFSKKSLELQEKLKVFMDKNVYPNESNILRKLIPEIYGSHQAS